jgi:signal transduction histidine kinase
MSLDTDAEILALRAVARDLVALSGMQVAWAGIKPTAVATGLADVLTELLHLDFVFVRLRVPGVADAVDVTLGKAWQTFPEWLENHLAQNGELSGKVVIPNIDDSAGPCRGVVIPVGVNAEGGVIAAARAGTDFPREVDQLLLSLAVNNAAAAYQSARLKEHQAQVWFLESLDRIDRAAHGNSDLDRMMGDVLDVVLATFRCDRAWLVYPCDPEVFHPGEPEISHRVRMERTRPEYGGARAAGVGIPNDPEVANVSRIALASSGPVRFDPESGHALPAQLAERFGVKSMIAVAVYPKVDRPYLLGLHQCTYRRVWALQEERLFHEIGRRLADALDTLLISRNLRESKRKLEQSRAELTASRVRIVTAGDEVRRRIERDLHDGAQQRLVSLALQLRAAQAAAPPEADELAQRLEGAVTEVTSVLEELREIANGLHPAILTQSGLRPALKALARRSAVPLRLDVQVAGQLPEPVEIAAYYAVSEALTNAAKHGHASAAEVEVAADDGMLRICIRDDGRGGADFGQGSGLVGLKDRIEALGGRICLQSPPGAGTAVQIALPLEGPGGAGWPGGAADRPVR